MVEMSLWGTNYTPYHSTQAAKYLQVMYLKILHEFAGEMI